MASFWIRSRFGYKSFLKTGMDWSRFDSIEENCLVNEFHVIFIKIRRILSGSRVEPYSKIRLCRVGLLVLKVEMARNAARPAKEPLTGIFISPQRPRFLFDQVLDRFRATKQFFNFF